MSNQDQTPIPLIVDPDEVFLDSLIKTNTQGPPPLIASSGKAAQLAIADLSQKISGVLINPAISNPSGISVIRSTHLHRPSIPVFLIYDNKLPFNDKELRRLGVKKSIQKPISIQTIYEIVQPKVSLFDPKKILQLDSLKPLHPLDTEIEANESNFVSIQAQEFVAGSVSYFDLYIKLGTNKFIKLLQAGDPFHKDRLQSYLDRGVKNFYLRKEAQIHYLNYCDRLASAMLKSKPKSTHFTVKQILNHGKETFDFFKTQGISESNLAFAQRFITNVTALVDQLKPGEHPLLKGFLQNAAACEHGVGVTLIASLLIPSLGIISVNPISTVGIAALFHDVGLQVLEIDHEDESKMTEKEKEKFRSHTIIGEQILSKVKGINPTVLQAVIQHHERRNKKGFPFRCGPGTLSMIAELIGVSDEFMRLVSRIIKKEKFNLNLEIRNRIIDCFSPNIVNEFRKVFLFSETQKK